MLCGKYRVSLFIIPKDLEICLKFSEYVHFNSYVDQLLNKKNWIPLRWRHNGRDGVSHHLPHDCLLNRLFRCRSKEISKLRVTGLFAGNSPVTGEFPAQMASNAENVSIWCRHHAFALSAGTPFNSDLDITNCILQYHTKVEGISFEKGIMRDQ